MTRLFLALALGIIGAGIVHIAVLFLLPQVTERDAWAQLSQVSDYEVVTPVAGPGVETPLIRSVDPLFSAVACRFSLENGALHVSAGGRVPFWSMSIYDRNGLNIFSFNDRTAVDGRVDFVVVTPAQTIELRKDLPEEFAESVFVEADIDDGIALIRSFVPDESWRPTIDAFLSGVSCSS